MNATERMHDYIARRRVEAETKLRDVALLHSSDDHRRKPCCVECGRQWPCRTRLVAQ
jgi:hypothetical protein